MLNAVTDQLASETKHRGYSYGVRHIWPNQTLPLLEIVDDELAKENPRPELTALELIELGAVYVNDERCLNVSRPVDTPDRIRIHTRPRRYSRPIDLELRIVSETDEILIVDKPAGLPVHALVDNIKDNLIAFLEDSRGGRLYITHRLDVETSGLVLLAKSAQTQARLNHGFATGTIKRTYAAYVTKPVSPGEFVHYMEPSPTAPKHVEVAPHDGWQECRLKVLSSDKRLAETSAINEGRTTWHSAQTLAEIYRLEIQLTTGRPQQIRAQLAALGAPIIGDEKYGSPFQLIDSGSEHSAIALRAISVSETSSTRST